MKVGDKVYLVKDSSSLNDTHEAVLIGKLKVGQCYTISKLSQNEPWLARLGPAVYLKEVSWWVGTDCVSLAPQSKRNLPSWF